MMASASTSGSAAALTVLTAVRQTMPVAALMAAAAEAA